MILPEEFELNAGGDFVQLKIAKVYKKNMRRRCGRKNNALDFDDLLVKDSSASETQPDVRRIIRNVSDISWLTNIRTRIPYSFGLSACLRKSIEFVCSRR